MVTSSPPCAREWSCWWCWSWSVCPDPPLAWCCSSHQAQRFSQTQTPAATDEPSWRVPDSSSLWISPAQNKKMVFVDVCQQALALFKTLFSMSRQYSSCRSLRRKVRGESPAVLEGWLMYIHELRRRHWKVTMKRHHNVINIQKHALPRFEDSILNIHDLRLLFTSRIPFKTPPFVIYWIFLLLL